MVPETTPPRLHRELLLSGGHKTHSRQPCAYPRRGTKRPKQSASLSQAYWPVLAPVLPAPTDGAAGHHVLNAGSTLLHLLLGHQGRPEAAHWSMILPWGPWSSNRPGAAGVLPSRLFDRDTPGLMQQSAELVPYQQRPLPKAVDCGWSLPFRRGSATGASVQRCSTLNDGTCGCR